MAPPPVPKTTANSDKEVAKKKKDKKIKVKF